MMAVAPHYRYIPTSVGRLRYCLMVWDAIVLSTLKAMREASLQDKANIVPTPFFYLSLSSGNWLA